MQVSSVPLSQTHIAGRPRERDDGLELAHDPQARQRGVGDSARHSRREVVDDRQDAKPAAVDKGVRLRSPGSSAGSVPAGTSAAARVPSARLRPPRRRTCSRSSR